MSPVGRSFKITFTPLPRLLKSSSFVLDFLSFLFHQKGLSPASISVHWAALSDPLKFGINIAVNNHCLELLRRGFFLRCPPIYQQATSWSLQAVLNSFPVTAPSVDRAFKKALFLLAIASGLTSSQLHALTRQPGLTVHRGWVFCLSCPLSWFLG